MLPEARISNCLFCFNKTLILTYNNSKGRGTQNTSESLHGNSELHWCSISNPKWMDGMPFCLRCNTSKYWHASQFTTSLMTTCWQYTHQTANVSSTDGFTDQKLFRLSKNLRGQIGKLCVTISSANEWSNTMQNCNMSHLVQFYTRQLLVSGDRIYCRLGQLINQSNTVTRLTDIREEKLATCQYWTIFRYNLMLGLQMSLLY